MANPYIKALPALNDIIQKNSRIDLLDGDLSFEDVESKLTPREPIIPTPPLTTPTSIDPSLVSRTPNIISPQSGLTRTQEALLSDPFDRFIAQQRNKII